MKYILPLCILIFMFNSIIVFGKPKLTGAELLALRLRELAIFNQDLPPRDPPWPSKNVNLSAFGNFDIKPKIMHKTLPGEEEDFFSLSNLGVNVDAQTAGAMFAHVGVAYFKTNKGQGDRYDNTGLLLDNAYFTVGDFAVFPFFLEGGRFYLPFGKYNRYDIIPTLTQILSIARETGAQLGVAYWHGFTGSFYISQGQLKKVRGGLLDRHNSTQDYINYGAALHYDRVTVSDFHFGFGVEYINNMLNVNALSENAPFIDADGTPNNHPYTDSVAGISWQARISYKRLILFYQYVSALKTSDDIVKLYQQTDTTETPQFGARPSAWDAGGIFKFQLFNRLNQIDFTYSQSYQSAGLRVFNSIGGHGLPEARYIAGYTLYINQNIYARFQLAHDWLYPEGKGDNGSEGEDIVLRIGAIF